MSVDTGQLDEGVGRLDRASDRLRDAGAGLDRLPVVGVATGADAVLDALADLGRQWRAGLDLALGRAGALAADLRTASDAYARAEQEATRRTPLLPDLLPGLVTPPTTTTTPAPAPAPGAARPDAPR